MKVVLKKDGEQITIKLNSISIAQFIELITKGYVIIEFLHY